MISQYIDCALGTSAFATKAAHTHLVLCDLAFHLILNGFDALAIPSLLVKNTNF